MSGALDEVKQCAMRLPGLGPSGGNSSQRSQCRVCSARHSRGRGVAGAGGEGERAGVLESVVSCHEDFAFCPKCGEVSLEGFEQRSATIRLVLKDTPDSPRGG